jgi:hypothetical protein
VGLHVSYFPQFFLFFLSGVVKRLQLIMHRNDVRIEDRPETGPRCSIS